MTHDISRLADKIRAIDRVASYIAEQDFGGQLGKIIHGPGWTTIAEFALVEASLDSLHKQLEGVREHYRRLIEEARKVDSNTPPHRQDSLVSQTGGMNISKLSQISVRRFSFFMRFIAENDFWDEAELHLDEQGCTDLMVSSEPILAIQDLIKEKIARGEQVGTRGRRVALSATCGGGHPTPPPRHPGPGPGGTPPGPPPDGGGPPPPPPPTPQ